MKILVVEDDDDLNRMLSRFLEKNGYEVHSAGDALQAFDVLSRVDGFGMVIVDLRMPHLDGVQFTEQFKADPRHANTPVIMMSAQPDDRKIDQGLRHGVAFFLPKPIELDRLLTLVRFAS